MTPMLHELLRALDDGVPRLALSGEKGYTLATEIRALVAERDRLADAITTITNQCVKEAHERDAAVRLIDDAATHWLSLNLGHPIQWEGAIDAAMAAACNEIRSLNARLAAVERDAKRYDYLRALLRHAKWNDIDTLHELKPEDEKYITDESIDSALDAQITYSRAAVATAQGEQV